MKHLLLTTIAAVLLVGCGEAQQSAPAPESRPEAPTAKAPDISIHDAAKAGNVEVVKQLLAAGADANEDSGFGMPPLQNAAAFGHKEVVELLIANGADVNIRNLMNLTALDQANILDLTDTIALLRKHGGKTGGELWAEESILGAAGIGDIGLVKKHLSDGVDVMQRDDMKATSLHHSATSEVAALLIKNGANVNAKDIGGQTPLHEAVNTGILKVAELLITKGADVNAKDESEDTPLHKATRKNNHEMIELLISKGADVNPKVASGAKQGKTPLDAANETNHSELAELLRKHGGKTGEELKVESINEESSISKKLTAREVAEIMAFNIGHWETNGEGMPVGGTKQAIEMRMEVRWKEEDESLEYKYTMNQNGEVVSYFGHEEYDAAKGVFVYRSKWGESPETTSHASYNPATRTSHAQTVTTKSAAKTKTVTTTKRVGNDKIQQNLRVFENGQLVYTHDVVSTRIEENKQ